MNSHCDARNVALSVFHNAADPRAATARLPVPLFADLVAPEHAPVRNDIRHLARHLRDAVGPAWRLFHDDRPPPGGVVGVQLRVLRAAWRRIKDAGLDDADAWLAVQKARDDLIKDAPKHAKARLPAWSPAIYGDVRYRAARNVTGLSALAFDIDCGMTLDDALDAFPGVPRLVATSWSCTPEALKFRLVVLLAEVVPVVAWPRVWGWGAARLRGFADKSCSNADRLYFLPGIQHEHARYEARQVDLDLPVLAVPPELLAPPQPPPAPPPPARIVRLPASHVAQVARLRLKNDADTRRRAGEQLGGRLSGSPGGGECVRGVTCPQCNRPSVWWWVSPTRSGWAACSHRDHCGWAASLFDLLTINGGVLHV